MSLSLNTKGFTTDLFDSGQLELGSSNNFLKAQVVLQKCTTCHSPTGRIPSKSFVFASQEEAFASPWFKKGDLNSPA